MRIAATGATLLLFLQACSTTKTSSESQFQEPNSLMAGEITRRVEQIAYQHRDELYQNLLWLAQTGEQTIPAMLTGLRNENPKVRSSCAWVLGRLRDRRTIPNLQTAMKDSEPGVRLEVARSLVSMGDLSCSPNLIEGLDSDKKEVRYMCHETLKAATGHDFGYDHLNQNEGELRLAVLRWRQWWGEYSGDTFFAQNYQRAHNLQPQVAAPNGETKPTTGGEAPNLQNAQDPPQPQNGTQSPGSTPTPGTQGQGNPAGNAAPPSPGTTPPSPTPGTSTPPATTPSNAAPAPAATPTVPPATSKPTTPTPPANKPATTPPATKPATTAPATKPQTAPGTNAAPATPPAPGTSTNNSRPTGG